MKNLSSIALVLVCLSSVSLSPVEGFAQQAGASRSSSSSWFKKVKDRTHLMYWSMMGGPSIGGPMDQSVDGSGSPMAPYAFNMLWSGVLLTPRDAVGVLNRFVYTFESRTAQGGRTQSSFDVRSPRLYWRRANAIDNSVLNLGTEVRWEIPTTDALRAMGNVGSFTTIQNFQIKTRDKNWFLGMSFFETAMFNRAAPNVLGLSFIPSASYALSPQWSIYSWAWLDADYRSTSGWTSAGPMADADYLRVGPMYSPSSAFQIYPCIQAYIFNPKLETLTLGLELSATL